MCHAATYSYAGLGSRSAVRGVQATIAPTAAPNVRDGHVAGWVGVGGYGVGPNGTDEWLQVGLMASSGSTLRLYYEVTRPGHQPVQRTVRPEIAVGERHHFAVVEVAHRPSWWSVRLDGRAVGAPIQLVRSHGRLNAQVMGESYDGLSEGACNLYSFSFRQVSLAKPRASVWSAPGPFELFQDPFYKLLRISPSSFLAASV